MYKLGVDLDGTALNAPNLFGQILRNWPNEVIALTARPETERRITEHDLTEAGIIDVFDEIVMFPLPYIYDCDDHTFWYDPGQIVFEDMEHRAAILRLLKAFEKTHQLPSEHFGQEISLWKSRVCLERGIKVMFEDSPYNEAELKKHGIYVFKVDREMKLN